MSRQHFPLQRPGLAAAMSAVGIAIVLTAALPTMRAVAQTNECLEFGPRRSASRALLITLTQFTEGRLRDVASYEVDDSIARMVRTGFGCRVALGSIVPLPGDLVSVVWPTAP